MVNGQSFSGTGYQLDGTENRDPILGIIVINPNLEAIGETKITSQNYDAEFGQAIAGVASVTTRSGSNDLHGSAFLFRKNDIFQARNPFSQATKNAQTGKFVADTMKNQFGGSLGGKIIKDKLFIFGDYDGVRSKIGGTQLLTVPTAAARTGDLSAYGVNIYDPSIAARPQFAGNKIPTARLSPQALNIFKLLPLPNTTGTLNGTKDNFVASGSEAFNKDSFDTRIDYRTSEKLTMFGRYSFSDFQLSGPTAYGAGGGEALGTLGGTSKVRNQSVATGLDYTWSPTLVTDFRFGFFRYKVNVLPFDFGKTTAKDAGINGLNFDAFSSGLPSIFINGNGIPTTNMGSGLGVNRCNCPLDQDENQFQFVTNTTKFSGNHTFKFGADFRRAFNLRVPSDKHRSGELTFDNSRTAGTGTLGGGSGLATFLLGDVTKFERYISTSSDARERQFRHFYYGQDSWRVNQKLTVNYGLRLDVINPQSINAPGNAGYLDITTGQINTVGVGSTDLSGNVKNTYSNFAPRLSVTYKATEKMVIRAGYGKSFDIGVFGSTFGHSVTQNLPVLAVQSLNATQYNSVFNLAAGAPAFTAYYGLNKAPKDPTAVVNTAKPSSGQFYLPDGVGTFVLPTKMRLPSVDAYNFTVQYQLTNKMSVEAAFVGNKGTHVFSGDGPNFNINQPTIVGFGTLDQNQRKPYYQKYGWTQGINYFCNCGNNRYSSLQVKLDKRFSDGYSVLMHYTWQKQAQDSDNYFIYDSKLNRGPAGWQRDHGFVLSQVYELPIGAGKKFLGNISKAGDLALGGWQFNSNTTIQSGLPFDNSFDTSGISDTGSSRPNINGTLKTGATRLSNGNYSFFNNLSVFSAPAKGTFGNQKANSLRGPGYWRTDASLFKKFKLTEKVETEFRVEAVNLFNHVNLGNPDGYIGKFNGTTLAPSGGAGSIGSTAYFGSDPQRNLQFALKLKF